MLMNEAIKKIINCLKEGLNEDPSSIVFGKLNDGIGEINEVNEVNALRLGKYYDLLKLSNGA